ncbi:MAG: hypothetical protein RI906_718 [Pseudomonadota bacterium]|jgi:heat shock protein HslJ
MQSTRKEVANAAITGSTCWRRTQWMFALALLSGAGLTTPSLAAEWALDDVRGARYGGVEGIPGEFHLVQGKWTGQPLDPGAASKPTVMLLDDTLATGEAAGGAHPEAAVVLAASFGGSGVFHYLAVLERRDGRPVSRQTWALGDRVQIKQVQIHGQRILVDMVRSGPGDPACCPTEWVTLAYAVGQDRSMAVGQPRPVQLADIGGPNWVLRTWGDGEQAQLNSSISLTFKDAALRGHAGCNSYVAGTQAGATGSALAMAPAATTRKMCEPDVMRSESRFLEALARAARWRFDGGRLALSADDGSPLLTFSREPR